MLCQKAVIAKVTKEGTLPCDNGKIYTQNTTTQASNGLFDQIPLK